MNTSKMPNSFKCPYCLNVLDATTAVDGEDTTGEGPIAGDVSICFYCGELSTFNEERQLTYLSAEERTRHESELDPVVHGVQLQFKRDYIRHMTERITQTQDEHEL